MKFRILLSVGLLTSITAYSQSLGVGTNTPNSKAALHVESPGNNQGFIMPRLTTAQRTSIAPLSAGDAGLMVYDTQLNGIYIWNGTVWVASTQGANGPRLQYPYKDSILTAPNNSNLFKIVYNGTGVENVGPAAFQNLNPNNGFSTLFVTNAGTNSAGYFQVNNINSVGPALRGITNSNQPNVHGFLGRTTGLGGSGGAFEITNVGNSQPALLSTTVGTGSAGKFIITNASNSSAAVYASTNGTGSPNTTAAIIGETATAFSAITGLATGNAANALSGIVSDPGPGGYAVLGSVSATGGGQAGVFIINNATNANNTLEASTNGTGGAAKFTVNNVAGTMPALWAQTNSNQPLTAPIYGLNTGTGDAAGYFRINNAASTRIALAGETNGSGSSVYGLNLGTGNGGYFRKNGATANSASVWGDNFGTDGYGGIFQNISTSNTKPALFAESGGSGASIWALKSTGDVSGNALLAENQITSGSAGVFSITNAANPGNAVSVSSNSTSNGTAISASQTGTGDAVFATATNGSAGNFQVNSGAGNSSALFAMTNSATGIASGAMNTANGSAFSIFQGGMKVSTATLSGGGNITTRAVAYQITSGASYTFNLTPALTDGEMFFVYNSSASPVTVAGANISASSGLLFIVLGGTPRPF